jgi:hypothetical protein
MMGKEKAKQMGDLQEQLAILRRKVARIDRKYAEGTQTPAAPADNRPSRYFIEQWMSGEVVETPFGQHFETEKLYERHRRHGSMDISNLLELPEDLLGALSGEEAKPSPVVGRSSTRKPLAWRAVRGLMRSWSVWGAFARTGSGCASSSCGITARSRACCGRSPGTSRNSTS